MESRPLRYFLAIVEHGGFTRAAARLHVSQSALSQAIRTLEHELDAPLFHRVGRGVVLSEAGRALLPHTRNVVSALQETEEALAEVRGLQSGSVAVATTPWLSVGTLAPLIAAFAKRRPQLSVSVIAQPDTERVKEALLSSRAEVGIVNSPARHQRLREHTLGEGQMYVALPPHTNLNTESYSLRQLANLPFIATPLGTMSRTLLENAISDGVDIHIVVDSPHRQSVIPLVLDGVGAAILPGAVASRAKQQGAQVVLLDPPFRFPIKLIHPRVRLAPVAREFVRIAAQEDLDID